MTLLDLYVESIAISRRPLLLTIDKSITKYQFLTPPLDGGTCVIAWLATCSSVD